MRNTGPSRAGASLLTVAQAAERLNVTPRTVRRMIARGQLTGYRLGGRLIRIDEIEIEHCLVEIPSARSHWGSTR